MFGQPQRDQHMTAVKRNLDQKSQNSASQNHATMVMYKIVSEYDQGMSQPHTTDHPTAP